jgi:signal peptidase I
VSIRDEASSDPGAEPPPDAVKSPLDRQIARGVQQNRFVTLNGHAGARHRPTTRGRHSARRGGRPRSSPWLRYGVTLLVTALIVLGLRTFVLASFYIPSESMEPTLHGCPTCQPDRVLVNKLSYRFSSVSRGDVVVFRKPPAWHVDDKDLVKRVIGLPGDVLSASNGQVLVNGVPLKEDYVNPACNGTRDFGPVTVPAGEYFVMGDNRCDSSDSRLYGPITKSEIVGRVFAIVWPLKRARLL